MDNLEKAARLLGTAPDALKNFPENVQNAMDTVMRMMEIHNPDDAMAAYTELERIWRNAIREEMLREVSNAAHLPEDIFDALPEALKNRIFLNYAASGNPEEAAEEATVVSRLPEVAEIMQVTPESLYERSFKEQKQLCYQHMRSFFEADALDKACRVSNLTMEFIQEHGIKDQVVDIMGRYDWFTEFHALTKDLYDNAWLPNELYASMAELASIIHVPVEKLRSLPLDVQNEFYAVLMFEDGENAIRHQVNEVLKQSDIELVSDEQGNLMLVNNTSKEGEKHGSSI